MRLEWQRNDCIDARGQSFVGNYVYDLIIPKNHFLRLLNQIVDWDRFTDKLIQLYGGGAEFGRPPFNPKQMLKMCLLAYLYYLSERQIIVFVNENLPAKYFIGLGLNHRAPDHATICVFRRRFTKSRYLNIFEDLIAEIVKRVKKAVSWFTVKWKNGNHVIVHKQEA